VAANGTARNASDRHLTAWAGVVPGNNETGDKNHSGKTRKGSRYLRRGLMLAARKKRTYLWSLYHRLVARRGRGRAAVAVGRTILRAVYHMIKHNETYRKLGEDYLDSLERERIAKRLVKRLQTVGFDVTVRIRLR
jgi:transposase